MVEWQQSRHPQWLQATLEEVAAQGDSVEEALKNLGEALDLYFEDQPFPDHIETPIIAPVDIPA